MTDLIRNFVSAAAAAALAAAGPCQAAAAQRSTPPAPCLSLAELRAMTTYALPSALDGVIRHCSPYLAEGGFLRRSGPGLVASYAAGRADAWPGAKAAFLKLAGEKEPESLDMVARMPDSTLQPFVEGMIGGLVGSKLKPGQCVLAETMIRLLAPLPPGNTAELLSTIAALAADKPNKGVPGPLAVCGG